MYSNHRLIHHFLEESARGYRDKVALIHEDVRATYGDIDSKANTLARWFIDRGIFPGDRIVLVLENCLEYVVSYYAALKAGAVVAPLSSHVKPDGLRPRIAELEPRIIISSSRSERMLQAAELHHFKIESLILKTPKMDWTRSALEVFALDDLTQAEFEQPLPNNESRVTNNELASIVYTSASTGKPKGVMLSHRNIVSNTHSICRYLKLTDKDIQMAVLPFFYVMGQSLLNTHFAVGGTVVISNKFAFPASVLKEMVNEKATGFSGVPSTYAYLLHRSPLAKYRGKLDSLRYISQAGGHMSRQIKEELRRELPDHISIYIMYGTTEASARLTCLEPDRFKDKMDSIGKPIAGVSLKILDDNGREVPNGQIGELVASGENIMTGYWNDPESTAKVLDQSGYHTGDLGFRDNEGFYYFSGRRDNLIKVGGHRINPQEIEEVLMSTGLLLENVILAIPDPLLGHKMIALAVPREGCCTQSEILAPCSARLPKYKLPSSVKLIHALPKNSHGKIDKTKCLELLS